MPGNSHANIPCLIIAQMTRTGRKKNAADGVSSKFRASQGFIRMETMSVQDLLEHGSRAALQKLGLLRVEGREYVIQEGDVCQVLFN